MSRVGKAKCPVCQAVFTLDPDLETFDPVDCPECAAELRIVSLDPVKVEEETKSFDYDEEVEEEDDEGA
ncbi:MAG: lysine biosynthesis protein LysW [Candidatus Omnitrophota bacterium]